MAGELERGELERGELERGEFVWERERGSVFECKCECVGEWV